MLKERILARIINPDNVGRNRSYLTKSVVLALRELVKQPDTNQQTLDLAAYITLALEAIAGTIDASVGAWEKRGYWIKADRFRMEWAWASSLGQSMRTATLQQDWSQVALTAVQIAEKLKHIDVPQRQRIKIPWEGAWDYLEKSAGNGPKYFSKFM